MSGAERLALRTVLIDRRRALLDRLAIDAAGQHLIEPAFLNLLADVQTAIVVVDAVLAETQVEGRQL
jgi:hypothetical protein